MERYLFAPLLISKLGQDDGLRSFFARLLKALAAVGAVAALIVFFLGWKELFESSSESMIGGILYQMSFVVAAYLAVHFTLLRAAEVKEDASRTPAALSIAAIVLRLVGEAWGFASAILGCGAAVYVWFAGREARILLDKTAVFFPFLEAGPPTFISGLALIVQGLLYGASALLLGYLLSEVLRLLPVGARAEAGAPEELEAGSRGSL